MRTQLPRQHYPGPRTFPEGLDPIRTDLGSPAVYLLLLGYYIAFLNLDAVTGARGFSNPIEKAILFAAALYMMMTRPVPPMRLVLLLAFACVPAISLLGTEYLRIDAGTFIRAFVSFMAPWMLMMAMPREREAVIFLVGLCYIPLFSVALGVVLDAMGINQLFYVGYDFTSRLQGSSIAAYLAAAAGLGAVAALMCARYLSWRYFILVAINLLILALTGGRMALAIALLALGFYVLARWRITGVLIAQGVFGLIVGLIGLFVLAPDMVQRIMESSDSGRGMMWAAIAQAWDNYPYFGIGLGHQAMIVPERVALLTTTIAAHNEYLRFGVELGWVGLSLLISVFIGFVVYTWVNPPKAGDFYFPVMCMLFALFCYTDNALSVPTVFGLMIVAYMERFVGANKPRRI